MEALVRTPVRLDLFVRLYVNQLKVCDWAELHGCGYFVYLFSMGVCL